MILSCILLRKMDIVVVSGFGAAIGLGRLGEIWALAKDAKMEKDTMPTGTTTRVMDRDIRKPPTCPDGKYHAETRAFSFQCIGRLNRRLLVRLWDKKSRKRETRFRHPSNSKWGSGLTSPLKFRLVRRNRELIPAQAGN